MQLMQDENWLYRSSSWADCLYSPCSGGVSLSRIIHGLILTSFSMKSSMSTTRSCRYGTLYSWKKGFASFSGRYRVTLIVAMSWLNLSIDTLFWFPSGYRDGTVIDPWRPWGLVCHRVREKVSIVPFRIVGPVVGPPRFASFQCRVGYSLCNV